MAGGSQTGVHSNVSTHSDVAKGIGLIEVPAARCDDVLRQPTELLLRFERADPKLERPRTSLEPNLIETIYQNVGNPWARQKCR